MLHVQWMKRLENVVIPTHGASSYKVNHEDKPTLGGEQCCMDYLYWNTTDLQRLRLKPTLNLFVKTKCKGLPPHWWSNTVHTVPETPAVCPSGWTRSHVYEHQRGSWASAAPLLCETPPASLRLMRLWPRDKLKAATRSSSEQILMTHGCTYRFYCTIVSLWCRGTGRINHHRHLRKTNSSTNEPMS